MIAAEGDWIRWTVPGTVKEGLVIYSDEPSLVVEWLDGVKQVFPYAADYFAPDARPDYRMVVIEKPPGADQIKRDIDRGHMSVARTAATLGTTKKQVRAWLRSGVLEGGQEFGRWVWVDADSVEEFRAKAKT